MRQILIVDDSWMDRRLVGGLLEKSGGAVISYAQDGLEALQAIRAHPPDLIITDLLMPRMDGLQLVSEVNRDFPHIPVLLITGHGSEQAAVQALRAGAASYVPKSALADFLVETVDHLLKVTRDRDQYRRLMERVTHAQQRFQLNNDPSYIPPLIQFLHAVVLGAGCCKESQSVRICVALEEALSNALYHGNLEITSDVRCGDAEEYRRIVQERSHCRPYRDRSIFVDTEITPEFARFVIRDQGPGFDPQSIPDPTDPANLDKPSGRGMLLMRTFMDVVQYNAVGNEVTLEKRAADAPQPDTRPS